VASPAGRLATVASVHRQHIGRRSIGGLCFVGGSSVVKDTAQGGSGLDSSTHGPLPTAGWSIHADWALGRAVAQHPALAPAHSSPCGRDQAVDVGLGEMNRGAVANVNDEDPSSVVGTERPAQPQQCCSHVPLSFGVSDGTRTRDIQDHNLTLYQLNYTHHCRQPDP
jgi:hypothetical protein